MAEVEAKSGADDATEQIDFVVFASSLHLFKNIKASLGRCVSFSRGKSLFDLAGAFRNALTFYAHLLKRKLPLKAFDSNSPVALSDEQELTCCYVVNTCEYCLEMIPKLESSVEDALAEDYREMMQTGAQAPPLGAAAEAPFNELIAAVVSVLVGSLEARCESLYVSQMAKYNWF